MKKVAALLAVLALPSLCGLVGVLLLPSAGTRLAMRKLVPLAAKHGAEISVAQGWKARFQWPDTIIWEGLSLRGRNASRDLWPPLAEVSVTVDRAQATLESFFDRTIAVRLGGLRAIARTGDPLPSAASVPREITIEGRSLSFVAVIDLLSPARIPAQLRELSREFAALARTGRCDLPLHFEGTATFLVEGAPAAAAIRVVREGPGSILTIDETDVLALSGRFNLKDPLTQDEVTLLARHPLKIPSLISVRNEVERKVQEALQRDNSIPQDAYRHLLLSFLLTKAYGVEFATLLTDSHERGITDNTEAERRMDLSNNALGRWFAAAGDREESLLVRVRLDHRVIRSAGEVGGKPLFGEHGSDLR